MKALNDYSFIRGVCYGWTGTEDEVRRDLGYAVRLQLNSVRIWVMYPEYWKDPAAFCEKLLRFVRIAHEMGISTMPILWNGNMIDPAILKPEYRETGAVYVKAIVELLKGEAGLLMWDIMNEPSCNDYLREAPVDEKPSRDAEMRDFVRHWCAVVRELDPVSAITVGHTFVEDLEMSADLVDVISFHDYLETRARIENSYRVAGEIAAKYGKPLINSELACLGRANPYDLALEICEKHKVGWYLFELMIHNYWGDVHGIVYPDGTVRDPAIVSAIMGFHRNRDLEKIVRPNANKEGYANRGMKLVSDALREGVKVFENRRSSTDELLEASEYCANLLEGCELVPMIDPPSVRIAAWRKLPEDKRNLEEIRAFAYRLAMLLKENCRILDV